MTVVEALHLGDCDVCGAALLDDEALAGGELCDPEDTAAELEDGRTLQPAVTYRPDGPGTAPEIKLCVGCYMRGILWAAKQARAAS